MTTSSAIETTTPPVAEPPAAESALLAFLDEIGVAWTLERHVPLFTVEDSKAATGHMPGAHTKNLFLKQKKGGYVLVVCLEDRAIRIKNLEKAIGMKRLSFGSPEALGEVLDVIPGSVTPFGLFNDREAHQVTLVLDQQMMEMDPLNYHPLHNEATITVNAKGLKNFFAATGHTPILVDFDALEAQSAQESVT
ncbi:MAG: prolyl-tRNA synthetase associated domain-containing protein [Pikeienuella sp.]